MNKTATKVWDWLEKRILVYERKLAKEENRRHLDIEQIDNLENRINEICAIQNYLLKVK